MDAGLGNDAKREPLYRLAAHRKSSDPGEYLCAEQAGEQVVGHYQPERPIGREYSSADDVMSTNEVVDLLLRHKLMVGDRFVYEEDMLA